MTALDRVAVQIGDWVTTEPVDQIGHPDSHWTQEGYVVKTTGSLVICARNHHGRFDLQPIPIERITHIEACPDPSEESPRVARVRSSHHGLARLAVDTLWKTRVGRGGATLKRHELDAIRALHTLATFLTPD